MLIHEKGRQFKKGDLVVQLDNLNHMLDDIHRDVIGKITRVDNNLIEVRFPSTYDQFTADQLVLIPATVVNQLKFKLEIDVVVYNEDVSRNGLGRILNDAINKINWDCVINHSNLPLDTHLEISVNEVY